ncbi:MAG: hypothetical protein R2784_20215 [Saprospiraceae bacterium]
MDYRRGCNEFRDEGANGVRSIVEDKNVTFGSIPNIDIAFEVTVLL